MSTNSTSLSKEYKQFCKNIEAIDEEIKETISCNNQEPIYDGALIPEQYFQSKIKILWLMKEAYEYEDASGGWRLPEFFENGSFYKKLVRGGSRATWQPVTYTTYGILNGFAKYNDMADIPNDPKMVDVLKQIAWVNIQKLPARGVTKTCIEDVYTAYENYNELIHRQIDLLNPDIIILGGVFNIVKNGFKLGKRMQINGKGFGYYTSDGRLYIEAYHPAQRTITRDLYVDYILNIARTNASLLLHKI